MQQVEKWDAMLVGVSDIRLSVLGCFPPLELFIEGFVFLLFLLLRLGGDA